MNSSLRIAIVAIGGIAVIAVIIAFIVSDGDDVEDLVANATATATGEPQSTTKPSPTARPTITPVPTPTATPEPTSTPTPTPTPTPIPTATPTPPPPASHTQEMARLIFEQDIEAGDLSVISVGAAQWPTEALGCPEPGLFYKSGNAPYNGFIYVLSDGSTTWEYHANADDSVIVRCDEIEPLTGPKVNIAQAAGLHGSTGVTLMRKDFSTGQFETVNLMTQVDLDRLIDILDRDIPLSVPIGCETVFRLDFQTPDGLQSIEWLCSEDKNLAMGMQDFWNAMTGTTPVQVGEVIGPYLLGPLPTLPTATP